MPGFESRAVMPKPTLLPSTCYMMPPCVAWIRAAQLFMSLCMQKSKQISQAR